MYFREILNLQVIPWRFDFFFCKFKNEIVKVKALLYTVDILFCLE